MPERINLRVRGGREYNPWPLLRPKSGLNRFFRGGLPVLRRIQLAPALLALALGCSVAAQAGPLGVRDKAPDFNLSYQKGNKVNLSDCLGKKNVVLEFYFLAFT